MEQVCVLEMNDPTSIKIQCTTLKALTTGVNIDKEKSFSLMVNREHPSA